MLADSIMRYFEQHSMIDGVCMQLTSILMRVAPPLAEHFLSLTRSPRTVSIADDSIATITGAGHIEE
jgi:hypothetical protein